MFWDDVASVVFMDNVNCGFSKSRKGFEVCSLEGMDAV
jgi:carboxypeptidase C (cathepsin A)